MNFASVEFWKLLLACLVIGATFQLVVRLALPRLFEFSGKFVFLATSLFLLGYESLTTAACFLWVTCVAAASVGLLGKSDSSRKLIVWISVCLQLAPLIYFKYWNFFFGAIVSSDWLRAETLIPMGISFYTFQTIGYVVDTYREGKRPTRIIDFFNFCSFFPQIVAGPIERRKDLLPQIEDLRFRVQARNIDVALSWIVLGLFYKLVLADNLANFAEALDFWAAGGFGGLLETFHYGLRIYFDFAGYSFIALGVARLFGVTLTLNFLSPYLSLDIREFWRRWHVTLGSWFRDYVYFPLGGSRTRFALINILIVFLVSGIWHGAGFGFIIWGVLHGVGVIASGNALFQALPKIVKWGITFTYAMFAWFFFFENSPEKILEKGAVLFNPFAYSWVDLVALPSIASEPIIFVCFAAITLISVGCIALEFWDKFRERELYSTLRHPVVLVLMTLSLVWFAPLEQGGFIYFNF